MSNFKVKLLVSRVTVDKSFVAGDKITVGNDEAWHLINSGEGVLVGKNGPTKPAAVEEAEAAAAAEQEKQAAFELPSVHPEGDEFKAEKARLEERLEKAVEESRFLASQLDEMEKESADLNGQVEGLQAEVERLNELLAAQDDSTDAAGGESE